MLDVLPLVRVSALAPQRVLLVQFTEDLWLFELAALLFSFQGGLGIAFILQSARAPLASASMASIPWACRAPTVS